LPDGSRKTPEPTFDARTTLLPAALEELKPLFDACRDTEFQTI